MQRETALAQVRERSEPWDVIVIGGGATGLGVSVDAAARGYDVLLCEAEDFSKGTSSRSTKLIHGGVRYLQQGNVSLVMDALKERGLLLQNAPHLVSDLAFIVPSYTWWASPFYGIGLKVYDLLAGRYGFGKSSTISKEEVIAAIPSINPDGLHGGTKYYDGQFDDSRLAINLASTAIEQDAVLLNYCKVVKLMKDQVGFVDGVIVHEAESGEELEISGKVIINATGPFTDSLRKLDHPQAKPIIAASQGVHIVLDKSFLAGDTAIMVPHTDDGRVMFAVPWYDSSVIGTTDTPIEEPELEPKALESEVEFILETANRYLAKPAKPEDIKSVFTGIRPLVKMGDSADTASLSRDHTILIDPDSGLLTVAGGKWTTYRKMAEDVVDQAITLGDLEPRKCVTENLPIHGHTIHADRWGELDFYGSDAPAVQAIAEENPELGVRLHPELAIIGAQVVFACREEMARTVEDVLARRTRCLFLNVNATLGIVPQVAEIMADELGFDSKWREAQLEAFTQVASHFKRVR